MIRGIIFDCFGVLYRGSLDQLRDITPPEHKSALMDVSRSSDLGYVTKEDYLKAVAQLTGKTELEIETILATWHIRNEAMFALLRSLKSNYSIAMLSNVGQRIMDSLFTPAELTTLFDEVVLSSDIHMMKPDEAIFELTAQRMGLLPEECVMIDDLQVNITAACQTGMQGIVCTSTDQAITDLRALLARE